MTDPKITKTQAERKPPTIVMCDAPVAVRGEPLGVVLWQGRQWSVTSDGIERRDGLYVIEKDRLTEDHGGDPPYSWIKHLSHKGVEDIDDFIQVFFAALVLHGYRLKKDETAMLARHIADAHARLKPS
jgi:hypothetical protein